MTSEILSMQPGPELDDMLAPLLGYRIEHFTWKYDDLEKSCTIWKTADGESVNPMPLSTTGDGMLLVVEAMAAKGWDFEISGGPTGAKGCTFSKDDDSIAKYAEAPTAPHAVSLAALLALEGDHAN